MNARAASFSPARRRAGSAAWWMGAALLATVTACRQNRDAGVEETVRMAESVADPEMLTYHPDLQVDVTEMSKRPSGLLLQDVAPGQGDTLGVGRTAVVWYTGWLHDGTEFDSNRGQSPFAFEVGAGDVITGWDEGLVGMRPGGKRRLVLPSALGYGEGGSGPIPPYATLVFEVELIEIR